MWYNKGSSSTKMFIGQSASGDATWFGTKHSTEVRVLSARLKKLLWMVGIAAISSVLKTDVPSGIASSSLAPSALKAEMNWFSSPPGGWWRL